MAGAAVRHGRRGMVAAGVAVSTIAVAAACGPATSPAPSPAPAGIVQIERHGFAGTLLVPPLLRPPLRLPDTSGRSFDLRDRPPGEVTVVFFGYTTCDDVCPTTMADLAAARRMAPAGVKRHVTVVFVTEDPARDTPAVVRRWLDRFDRQDVGLIGGNDTTRKVLDLLHLPRSERAASTTQPSGAGRYELEHSGSVYAFGPRGRTVLYTGGTTPRQYAADFARLLTG